MQVTLQRARTAREALKIMTDLVAKYGYQSEGETFTVAALRANELAVHTNKMDNVIICRGIHHQRNGCVRVRHATYGERSIMHFGLRECRRISL